MLIAALVIGALVFEWRDRIFLAGATALLLIVCMRTEGLRAGRALHRCAAWARFPIRCS